MPGSTITSLSRLNGSGLPWIHGDGGDLVIVGASTVRPWPGETPLVSGATLKRNYYSSVPCQSRWLGDAEFDFQLPADGDGDGDGDGGHSQVMSSIPKENHALVSTPPYQRVTHTRYPIIPLSQNTRRHNRFWPASSSFVGGWQHRPSLVGLLYHRGQRAKIHSCARSDNGITQPTPYLGDHVSAFACVNPFPCHQARSMAKCRRFITLGLW